MNVRKTTNALCVYWADIKPVKACIFHEILPFIWQAKLMDLALDFNLPCGCCADIDAVLRIQYQRPLFLCQFRRIPNPPEHHASIKEYAHGNPLGSRILKQISHLIGCFIKVRGNVYAPAKPPRMAVRRLPYRFCKDAFRTSLRGYNGNKRSCNRIIQTPSILTKFGIRFLREQTIN